MSEYLRFTPDSVMESAENQNTPNPVVRKIVYFDKIQEESSKKDSPSTLSEQTASYVLDEIHDEFDLREVHHAAYRRIQNEAPEYIRPFHEIGISNDPLRATLSGNIHGVEVKWDEDYLKDDGALGQYSPKNRAIAIAYKEPDNRKFLYNFAVHGRMPRSFMIYAHEFVHDLQRHGGKSEQPLQKELIEAQAFLLSDPEKSIDEITSTILTAKNKKGDVYYKNINPDKLDFALHAINILNKLGISQQSIAQLVRDPGNWDEDHLYYEQIMDVVDQLLSDYGLQFNDIDCIDTVIKAHQSNKVKAIVFEEIQHILGHKTVSQLVSKSMRESVLDYFKQPRLAS